MRRFLFVLAGLALTGATIWLVRWLSVSPGARVARPYAREFVSRIEKDARFTNVHVRVLEYGSKGPVYVTGTVWSDCDANELHRAFDSLHCPVGVSWQLRILTNHQNSVAAERLFQKPD